MRNKRISLAFAVSFIIGLSTAQVTHISNNASTLDDGILNLQRQEASTNTLIDILGIHRSTSGTAGNGIGGSIVFRNELDNGGFGLGGRISSIATNVSGGNNIHAMRFDVFSNGAVSRTMYLNGTGLGIGTFVPSAMLDVSSQTSTPAHFRGIHPLWMGIYEDGSIRGYLGSYSGATVDVDFGTSSLNGEGKLHLTTHATPRLTIDPDGLIGINTQTPAKLVDIQGSSTAISTLRAEVNYVGNSDLIAVEGYSVPNPGYGYGAYFTGGWRGCYVTNAGGSYTGTSYGLYAQASGTAGTRIAIFGAASGGAVNWAGYFTSGNVYMANELRIGTTDGATGYKVSVDGKIAAEELRVQNSASWPDYVFAEDYPLRSLEELEAEIKTNKHLPGIPPAHVIDTDGIHLGEMQSKTIEKIEELTLYVIELHHAIEKLKVENDALRALIIK